MPLGMGRSQRYARSPIYFFRLKSNLLFLAERVCTHFFPSLSVRARLFWVGITDPSARRRCVWSRLTYTRVCTQMCERAHACVQLTERVHTRVQSVCS
jgi:hypothetical protein